MASYGRERLPSDGDDVIFQKLVERPVMSGLAQTFDRTGSSIMPYLSGLIQVRYGFAPLFIGAGSVYLISALLMYAMFGHADDRTSDSQVP